MKTEDIVIISFSVPDSKQLAEYGKISHIWICHSGINDQSEIEELRKLVDVTTFVRVDDDPLVSLLDIIPTVVEHHPLAKISFFAKEVIYTT